MKMLNLFLISLLVLTASTSTYAEDAFPKGRTAAVHAGEGNDPNGDGAVPTANNQSGYTKAGKNPSEQVPICEHCQDSPVLLTESKRIAGKGSSSKPSDSPASNVKSGQ